MFYEIPTTISQPVDSIPRNNIPRSNSRSQSGDTYTDDTSYTDGTPYAGGTPYIDGSQSALKPDEKAMVPRNEAKAQITPEEPSNYKTEINEAAEDTPSTKHEPASPQFPIVEKMQRNARVFLAAIGLGECDIPPEHKRIRWTNVSVIIHTIAYFSLFFSANGP